MSISISLKNNRFSLEKLNLPTRYYYFCEDENYIKLLNIGEGIFPKDKIGTILSLDNSSLILANESATKVYKSKKEFGINRYRFDVYRDSNFEFLNDELILYKDSKFIQFFRLNFDQSSTFFYSDLMSSGRSFEHFDFSHLAVKNSFYYENTLEYLEKYQMSGEEIQNYLQRRPLQNTLFAKIYMKTKNNPLFEEMLKKYTISSIGYSQNKHIIIVVISDEKLFKLKEKIATIWELFRNFQGKKKFNLGKQ